MTAPDANPAGTDDPFLLGLGATPFLLGLGATPLLIPEREPLSMTTLIELARLFDTVHVALPVAPRVIAVHCKGELTVLEQLLEPAPASPGSPAAPFAGIPIIFDEDMARHVIELRFDDGPNVVLELPPVSAYDREVARIIGLGSRLEWDVPTWSAVAWRERPGAWLMEAVEDDLEQAPAREVAWQMFLAANVVVVVLWWAVLAVIAGTR